MSEFNSKNKFLKISEEWQIKNDDLSIFDKYNEYLKNYNFTMLSELLNEFNLTTLTSVLNKILDFIFVFNYIEENATSFSVTLDTKEKEEIKLNGVKSLLFNEINLNNFKNEKQLIVHFSRSNKSEYSNKVINVSFSLLDKKYSIWDNAIKKSNLISIIHSLDQFDFLWSNVDIKKQYSKKDLFFASVNLDVNEKDVCDLSLDWLQTSNWAAFYNEAQSQLKFFCKINKIPYHYSTNAIERNVNQSLRNINFEITETFVKIYNLFVSIRKKIHSKNKKWNYQIVKKHYLTLCYSLLDLLKQKSICIKYLIYAIKKVKEN